MEKQFDTICKPKTFEKAYNTHAKDLRNFMYYKCGDIDMAEDFVQDAFVKLWQNCAKVLWEKSKSFLFTVANNLFLNTISHKKVVLAHHKLVTHLTHNDMLKDDYAAFGVDNFCNSL